MRGKNKETVIDARTGRKRREMRGKDREKGGIEGEKKGDE